MDVSKRRVNFALIAKHAVLRGEKYSLKTWK